MMHTFEVLHATSMPSYVRHNWCHRMPPHVTVCHLLCHHVNHCVPTACHTTLYHKHVRVPTTTCQCVHTALYTQISLGTGSPPLACSPRVTAYHRTVTACYCVPPMCHHMTRMPPRATVLNTACHRCHCVLLACHRVPMITPLYT